MGDKKDELPVMVYDWLDESIREIAENIWHAQKGGRPDVLTYLYRSDKEKRLLSNLEWVAWRVKCGLQPGEANT